MDMVTDYTMAIDSTFNSIVNEIQLSKLNFSIQLTPFAAYITLKKSTQLDKEGIPFKPSPPLFMVLQQLYNDMNSAKLEIDCLNDSLRTSENKCEELSNNIDLLRNQLKSADENLTALKEVNCNLLKKVEAKDMEIARLDKSEKNLTRDLKKQTKEHSQHVDNTDASMKLLNKTLKSKEKDIHNLSRDLDNARDTIHSLKAGATELKNSEAQLKSEVKRLDKRVKSLEYRRNHQITVSSQTSSSRDIPYSVTDELPPIFGSKICTISKDIFLSKSLPNVVVANDEVDVIMRYGLEAKHFDGDDEFKCKICGLSYKSQQELQEHDRAYTYCCRQCLICFKTLRESQNHLC